MFWPFRRKPAPLLEIGSPDPPAEKQLRYAKSLGIDVPTETSKQQLSAKISEALRNGNKPKALQRSKRLAPKSSEQRERERQLEALADQWIDFANNVEYMLAVYRCTKETIVDVLRVNDAFVSDDRNRGLALDLLVASPKLVKDRDIGDYLEWEREFDLPIESLLYHEPLGPNFADDGNAAYQGVVRKGLEIGARL